MGDTGFEKKTNEEAVQPEKGNGLYSNKTMVEWKIGHLNKSVAYFDFIYSYEKFSIYTKIFTKCNMDRRKEDY